MSLRARLLVLVALATLVPAILAGVRFFQNRTSEINTALVNLSETASGIANDLDGKIQGAEQLQFGLLRARDLDTRDRAACSAFLAEVREDYPQYTGLLTINPDGSLFCDSLQTNRTLDLKDRDYFKRAVNSHDAVILEPAFGRLTGMSVLQIAYPARSEITRLKFVLLASLNLQSFADHHNDRLPRGTAVLIVDRNGTVLVRPSAKDWFPRTAVSIAGTDLFRLATSNAGAHAGEVAGLEGEMQVWAVATSPAIRDAGLYFMVGRARDDLVAAANSGLVQDLTILAAVSLLLFVGVWTLAELGFRRQVGRIAHMAAKLGQGDLSVRINLPFPGGELGGLMTMLNGTAVSLERQRNSIHELNRKLHQSQKMEALGQLTGGLAHDFNNLLTVILGNAEYLAGKLSNNAELRTFADGTVTAAERGAELTKSLLAFSRQQPLAPKDIDVGRQISGMEAMLRQTLGTRITFKSVLANDTWPAAIDPAQFEAAILNVVINARDAMPDGGSVILETRNSPQGTSFVDHAEVPPGDFVMVSVTDTGTGMPPAVAARAFEPFFTTKSVGKGTGLGLSMAYGFMKQSGGTMQIYSELGHGTVVKLYLPRADALPVMDKAPGANITVIGGSESILVVEDDDMVRAHVERELDELGYHVILARNGAAALDILGRPGKIDLLFTDVVMAGGMFGPQLAEQALRMRPDLKVLYTSGYTENALVQSSRLDAGIKLLHKPYRRQGLADMLRSVLTPH